MLEYIQNHKSLDEQVLAPSFLVRETYTQSAEFKKLLALALDNFNHSKPCQQNVPFVKQHLEVLPDNTCADYLITDDNIREECDRNEGIQVSFNFALTWLKHEILKISQSGQ